ncbi:hypothetical protein BTZ20_0859 [Rhodococcus sp. MTM3W5.2]|nr:hypothetical protein BTZ20_0859 [Rhodococcus sp. MTM3W5.2]
MIVGDHDAYLLDHRSPRPETGHGSLSHGAPTTTRQSGHSPNLGMN